jgi:hypothetical protein
LNVPNVSSLGAVDITSMHPVPRVEFLEALPSAAQHGPPLFGRESGYSCIKLSRVDLQKG